MQSTTQQSDAQRAEFIHQYTLSLRRAKLDAVDVLHRLMLQLVEVLTTPPEPETKRSIITTQRMRLAHRTAIDILNTRLPDDPAANPRAPRTPPTPPSPAQRETVAEASQRPVKVPSPSPTSPAGALATAAASSPLPQITAVNVQPSAVRPPPLPNTPAHPLQSPSPVHDPERSTHDRSALTPAANQTPTFVTFDPFVVKTSSPALLPDFPTFPPRPPDLTVDELASLNVRQRGLPVPFTPRLTQRLRQWHLYTDATGIKAPFDVEPERLITRKLRPSRKVLSAIDPAWQPSRSAKTGPPPTT